MRFNLIFTGLMSVVPYVDKEDFIVACARSEEEMMMHGRAFEYCHEHQLIATCLPMSGLIMNVAIGRSASSKHPRVPMPAAELPQAADYAARFARYPCFQGVADEKDIFSCSEHQRWATPRLEANMDKSDLLSAKKCNSQCRASFQGGHEDSVVPAVRLTQEW